MLPSLLFGQRLFWWLAGLALPARPAIAFRLRQGTLACFFATASGMLVGALLLGMAAGLYIVLTAQGWGAMLVALMIGALLLLVAIALFLAAQRHVLRAAGLKDDLKLFPQEAGPAAEGGLSAIATAFLEGLLQPPAVTEPVRPRRSNVAYSPVNVHVDGLTPEALQGGITRPIYYPGTGSTH